VTAKKNQAIAKLLALWLCKMLHVACGYVFRF